MINIMSKKLSPSPYLSFTRPEWSRYRLDTPLPLNADEIENLRGCMEEVSAIEIEQIYLPLSRLLSYYIDARQGLYRATRDFLQTKEPEVPYIIGVSGSVAVGKSTTSRVLKALLARWPSHPSVAIITTDGFLYPTAQLEAMGLMERKGFPESYDVAALRNVLHAIKSGVQEVKVPVYSHHHYDIVPGEFMQISKPDIIIVEGLNILQTQSDPLSIQPAMYVSDYLDFTLYVDADTAVIKQWYIDRVLQFWQGPFREPDSYFHYLTKLKQEEVAKFAEKIWCEINELNLMENILPFRQRARMILHKSKDHSVQRVDLRKL